MTMYAGNSEVAPGRNLCRHEAVPAISTLGEAFGRFLEQANLSHGALGIRHRPDSWRTVCLLLPLGWGLQSALGAILVASPCVSGSLAGVSGRDGRREPLQTHGGESESS